MNPEQPIDLQSKILDGCMPRPSDEETDDCSEVSLGLQLMADFARARQEQRQRLRVAIDGPLALWED